MCLKNEENAIKKVINKKTKKNKFPLPPIVRQQVLLSLLKSGSNDVMSVDLVEKMEPTTTLTLA